MCKCRLSEPCARAADCDFEKKNEKATRSEVDIYKRQDEIGESLKQVTGIIKDAKENDPEFYNELKKLFNS